MPEEHELGDDETYAHGIALFLLSLVGALMLSLLFVKGGIENVDIVAALVSSILFIPALWLAHKIRTTLAYFGTTPFLVTCVMAVAGSSDDELSQLEARITRNTDSINLIGGELEGVKITLHTDRIHSSEPYDDAYDLSSEVVSREREPRYIEGTTNTDVCVLASVHWAHGEENGRRFVELVRPGSNGMWGVHVLHSYGDGVGYGAKKKDSVDVKVMCIGLPDPVAMERFVNRSDS